MKTFDEELAQIRQGNIRVLGQVITLLENRPRSVFGLIQALQKEPMRGYSIGITGAPGCGKSTLISGLIKEWRARDHKIAVVAVDPSSPFTGGAILADRIRMMSHSTDDKVLIRSLASRGRLGGLAAAAANVIRAMFLAGANPVLVETVGVGQSEYSIAETADLTVVVLAPGMGDDIQAIKSGLLEFADIFVVNKADRDGADALALQMEEITAAKKIPVIKTAALKGSGIVELIDQCEEIIERKKKNLTLEKRREIARQREILDFFMDDMEDRARNQLESRPPSVEQDTLSAAETLLKQILEGTKNEKS